MIQQIAFDIPDKIVPKLLSGEYIQYGGVIRDTTGRIVMHLKPVTIQQVGEQSASIAVRVANFAKSNKNVAIVAGAAVVAAAVAGGVAIYQHIQKKDEAVLFTNLNAALADYMDAIDKGKLNEAMLDHAIDAIDSIINRLGGNDVRIEISGDGFAGLVKTIHDYTKLLLEANAAELAGKVVELPDNVDGTLENLRDHLNAQRKIFKFVA